MPKSARRYFQIVIFRVGLAVMALLTAAWAGHQLREDGPVWLIASIFAASASVCLIWPLVVPAENSTMVVYSVGPAFYLAGMFLLPPGLLVLVIGFSTALSGIVYGTRAYRTVFQLSASILAFGGFALFFHLGPDRDGRAHLAAHHPQPGAARRARGSRAPLGCVPEDRHHRSRSLSRVFADHHGARSHPPRPSLDRLRRDRSGLVVPAPLPRIREPDEGREDGAVGGSRLGAVRQVAPPGGRGKAGGVGERADSEGC